MARCDVCGNDYDKTFEVRHAGRSYTFDSIECAAQRIAPQCLHCACRILGHGVEQDSTYRIVSTEGVELAILRAASLVEVVTSSAASAAPLDARIMAAEGSRVLARCPGWSLVPIS